MIGMNKLILTIFNEKLLDLYGVLFSPFNNRAIETIPEYDQIIRIDNLNSYYLSRKPIESDKQIIIILSGGTSLVMDGYIIRMIHLLAPHNLPIYCPINEKELNITLYDPVADWVRGIANNYPTKEICIIGFSAGGCMASHVMSRIKDISNKKRIITYDSTHSVYKTVKSFQLNSLRFDRTFANRIYQKFNMVYDLEPVSDPEYQWIINSFMKILCCSEKEVAQMMSMCYDQDDELIMININTTSDPLIDYRYNKKSIEKYKSLIKFKIVEILNPVTGHCTDMLFTDSSNLIIKALNV
jgi:hypothetical protein